MGDLGGEGKRGFNRMEGEVKAGGRFFLERALVWSTAHKSGLYDRRTCPSEMHSPLLHKTGD